MPSSSPAPPQHEGEEQTTDLYIVFKKLLCFCVQWGAVKTFSIKRWEVEQRNTSERIITGKTEGELTKKPRSSSRILLSLPFTQRRYLALRQHCPNYANCSLVCAPGLQHFVCFGPSRQPAGQRSSPLRWVCGVAAGDGRDVRRGRAWISELPPLTTCTPPLKAGLVSKANRMEHFQEGGYG